MIKHEFTYNLLYRCVFDESTADNFIKFNKGNGVLIFYVIDKFKTKIV